VTLSDEQLERYARQLVLAEWGAGEQEAVGAATAIVVGAGALGTIVAAYLAGAGIGRLGIVDDDAVELSNLARQPLYATADLGQGKADLLARRVGALNPDVVAEPYPVRMEDANAEAIVAAAAVVVDCTDSFSSRYAVNKGCCAARVPLVEGGVAGFEGLVLSVFPGRSACYRCAFPTAPADARSCAETGILGPMAGIIASIQALEALKLVSGVGEPLLDTILTLEGTTMSQLRVATARRPDCADCGALTSNAGDTRQS